jgi:hypothetical protein
MNTNETQQAMKNNDETYISLFEYLGKGSGGSNIGREVTAEAIKRGIEIKWRVLPKEAQKPEYSQVQLYPVSFLDDFFATKPDMDLTPIVRRSSLIQIYQRIEDLESKIEILLNKLETNVTNSNEYHDDDLPF